MLNFVTRVAIAIVLQVPVFAEVSDEDCNCTRDACAACGKAAAMFRLRPEDGESPPPDFGPRENLDATDVVHHRLDLEILPASATLVGRNTSQIRVLSDGLAEFTFRLKSNMTITAAALNGVAISPTSIASLGTFGRVVPLDRAYAAGEEFELQIDYTGQPTSLGFGSFRFGPVSYSFSEPYFAGTWWPTKDGDAGEPGDNVDKFTLEFNITTPAARKAVSNGLLVGTEDLPGNRRTYRWRTDYPIAPYLVSVSAAAYNTWTVPYVYPGGQMPVEFNVLPSSDTPAARAAWELAVTALEVFRPIFGLYPFIDEKYGIYQFPFGGGMEHQTNTGQGTFDEGVTAHEVAHQWWGDAITCRTWHDIWLNEGFATYGAGLYFERKPGSSGLPALRSYMNSWRPSSVGDSVYVYDTTNWQRIFDGNFTYAKAAWVLHMLRHVVGDATFFQILTDYRSAFEGGAATTDDFVLSASASAGRDLAPFFQQWVYGIGAPEYQFAPQFATIDGRSYVRLYLRQVQSAAYPTFVMPLDVRVNLVGGGSQTLTLLNDARAEHFVLPLSRPGASIVLDEFDWVLSTGRTQIAYVNGPPKIVTATPAPGAAIRAADAPASLRVTFSDTVATQGDYYTLSGPGGPIALTFSHDAATFSTTLVPATPLTPGAYTLTVSESVAALATGIGLDGEIDAAGGLPSGEGLAGGAAQIAFRIRPPCSTDVDGDDATNLGDVAIVLQNFGLAAGATPEQGDVDGDGDVELTDLAGVLVAFGSACP
jgi:aminopeptidase N